MEYEEFRLAKALARNSAVLDDVIRLFMQRVLQSQKVPSDNGVQFAEVEDSPFALTATVHRRVVDIEFENAVLVDPDYGDKHLIAQVTLYLRRDGSERHRLPSPIFIFANGIAHLINDYVVPLDDSNCSPNALTLIRESLSELVLRGIHPTLSFYKDKDEIR